MRVARSIVFLLVFVLAFSASADCYVCFEGLYNNWYCKDPFIYSQAEGPLVVTCIIKRYCTRVGTTLNCTVTCEGQLCFIV